MKTLNATFRIVTPMFLAGADQKETGEIRLPSMKGALRFWYRAIDPEYRKREEALFGGTGSGDGQARFLMRLTGEVPVNRQNTQELLNPLKYFLFPVLKPQNAKCGLAANQAFKVQFLMKPVRNQSGQETERDWKDLMASVWLLGHLGGLGFRSRRGFGTVALESWGVSGDEEAASLLARLPLGHGADTPEEWMERLQAGLKELRGWYPGAFDGKHTHLGPGSRFFAGVHPQAGWLKAMEDGMNLIAGFRRDNRKSRLALGLPMIVPRRGIKYQPKNHNRMASPVFFRVVRVRSGHFPMFALLDAPIPQVSVMKGKEEIRQVTIPSDWKELFAKHLTASGYREMGREVKE